MQSMKLPARLEQRMHSANLHTTTMRTAKPGVPLTRMQAAAQPSSMRNMSSKMKEVRSQMEQDEQLKVLMAGFRGTNLNESDFAGKDVKMSLVEVIRSDGDDEQLPLVYQPDVIGSYWERRPVSIITRCLQLLTLSSSFLGKFLLDFLTGKLKDNEIERAVDLRNILTSLGPAYIKLGQALSIRPDVLSPAVMNEMQQLCDKVPSFDSKVAMQMIQDELGAPWYEIFDDLTPEPIAAASLGQVYKGKLKSGETVAVKVQRPYVLETVTIDLYIIRKIGLWLRQFPQITTDVVALLDEWASRFFEELDYVHEGNNAKRFAEQMKEDLPQVVVPETYFEYTSRRVLTTQWLEGEKLSQSKADDVGTLVNVGVICFLKQLLETGFFHADPHPGNLIRTPDGRLAILDFGLMTEVDDNIKYGMVEAISHLIHRDYEAIVKDFVTLDFIPEGTDLKPILPVLAKVFDQALEGGGAKNINFQDLAADLAQITFDYPFRIPPYFALIIRAIGVLEGIALVGNPEFALVDEAYPYISKLLLTDDSPRLRAALKYMVYGKQGVFDADRLIDLLGAYEDYASASVSATGDMDLSSTSFAPQSPPTPAFAFPFFSNPSSSQSISPWGLFPGLQSFAPMAPALPVAPLMVGEGEGVGGNSQVRAAVKFTLSKEGAFFREFILDEVVKSVDALSREQLSLLVHTLALEGLRIPILLPGARQAFLPLAPHITNEDRAVVANVTKIIGFLSRNASGPGSALSLQDPGVVSELLPVLPAVAREVVPQLVQRLASRVAARLVRELYM